MTTIQTCREDVCRRIFYGVFEFVVALIIVVITSWYAQSQMSLVKFENDNHMYDIVAIEKSYIDVRWLKVSLKQNCPGEVEPAIWGYLATHSIEPYAFVIDSGSKTFTRRYDIPDYFVKGEYEVRLRFIAHCNPLFPTVQILRVPFYYDPNQSMTHPTVPFTNHKRFSNGYAWHVLSRFE